MKSPYCATLVSTPEALQKALETVVSAIFVDENLLDDQVELSVTKQGYFPGLVGWSGKLFFRTDFDFTKYDCSDSLSSLGIRPEVIDQLLRTRPNA